jgi:hypothetical protein
MEPAALAWALAQPEGSTARRLAAAISSGVRTVEIDGRRIAYRDMSEMTAALVAVWRAEVQPRRVRRIAVVSSKGL